MEIISDEFVPANSGWGAPMKKGQVLRLTAKTIIGIKKHAPTVPTACCETTQMLTAT